jgi:hypothetical protein
MQLGHLLTRSGVERLEVSLMISPGFFCDIKIDLKNRAKRAAIRPVSVKVAGGKWLAVGNMAMEFSLEDM